MKQLDYYFWLNSDWAYLGAQRFEEIAARHSATVTYKPVDLLAVYSRTGGIPLHARAPQRQAYREQELRRWIHHLGAHVHVTPKHMCPNATLASHFTVAAQALGFPVAALHREILAAQWCHERDISNVQVLVGVAESLGLPGAELLDRANAPDIAARYERYTDDAVAAGVFGSPSYVLDGEVFWGQDRLGFLERALGGHQA